TCGEAWWYARRGTAMTSERVTIYGLPIVEGRRITRGRVDPEAARRMFIQHALVAGDWHTRHAFAAANRALIEELRELEERTRRRDLLVGDDRLAEIFDRRLGAEVVSARHFDRWWRVVRRLVPVSHTPTWADTVDPVDTPA